MSNLILPMYKIYRFFFVFLCILFCYNSLICQELDKNISDAGLRSLEQLIFQDLTGKHADLNMQKYLLSDDERGAMIEKLNKFVDSASLNSFGKLDDVLKTQAINYIKGNHILFKSVEFLGFEKSDYYGYDLFGFHYNIEFKNPEMPASKINVIFSEINENYKLLFVYCNNLNF